MTATKVALIFSLLTGNAFLPAFAAGVATTSVPKLRGGASAQGSLGNSAKRGRSAAALSLDPFEIEFNGGPSVTSVECSVESYRIAGYGGQGWVAPHCYASSTSIMIQLDPNLLPSPPSNATAAVAEYMAQGLGPGQLWDVTGPTLWRPTEAPDNLDVAVTLSVRVHLGPDEIDLDGLRVGYSGAGGAWWVGGRPASVSEDTQTVMTFDAHYQFAACLSGAYAGCLSQLQEQREP